MEMLRQQVPLWSPSADATAARVHRATRGGVRVLGHGDTPALERLLATDPVANVSVSATIRARRSAGPGKGRNGDLLVTVEVAVPKRLTPAAEEAVKVLEAELGDPRPRITAAVQRQQGGAPR